MLQQGDVLMTAAGATVGKSLTYNDPRAACYAGYLVRFRARPDVDRRFVAYWCESKPYWDQIATGKVVSTIDNFSASRYQNLRILLPPLTTQRAVADYLDRETPRIDAILAAKQRLIDLLAEQREAFVAKVVRTGVALTHREDATSDAEIEWLGRTPSHWQVMPLKRVADHDNSGAWGDDPGVLDVDLPVATTAQIDADGEFLVMDMPVRSFRRADVTSYACKADQILVVKSSGSASNIISGKAGLVRRSTPAFIFSNFLLRLRPLSDTILAEFLYSFLTSRITRERIKRMVSATTYPNLRVDEYMSSLVPVPPLDEQANLVKELSDNWTRHLNMRQAQVRSIDLLHERRQALITAAVTGELDIVEAA